MKRRRPIIRDLSDELARDRRTARLEFKSSIMSNTKWQMIFSRLRDEDIDVRQIIINFC